MKYKPLKRYEKMIQISGFRCKVIGRHRKRAERFEKSWQEKHRVKSKQLNLFDI